MPCKPTDTERTLLKAMGAPRGPETIVEYKGRRIRVGELAELVKAKTDAGVEWFERQPRDFKMRWLLGQALDGTLTVGCPHQIIHKFAAEFKALPRDAALVTEDKSGQWYDNVDSTVGDFYNGKS